MNITESGHRKLYHPKKRPQNNDSTDDFVAIDFETMSSSSESACSIGLVKIIDGEIVQRFYSLINPVRDDNTERELYRGIHGIALSTAEKADTFDVIFNSIRNFIGALPIVCHNKYADIRILSSLMDYYHLSGIDLSNCICTYEATGLSLSDCCARFGIPMAKHHDALSDAEACALIYLELIGKPHIDTACGSLSDLTSIRSKREIKSEYKKALDTSMVADKSTPFFGAKVVITGVFEKYPDRNDLAQTIQSLGAKINQSISKKTDIVVIGAGAGPKKIETINNLRESGVDIRLIREMELYQILETAQI